MGPLSQGSETSPPPTRESQSQANGRSNRGYEVTAKFNSERIGSFVLPHMHRLGREIRTDKVSESGKKTPLVYIDHWDFDLREFYTYVKPVPLHLTDRLEVSAIHDNSANNPRNPNNSPVAVGWGNTTSDEMCIVFFTRGSP